MLIALCVQASTQALQSMHSSAFTTAFSCITFTDSLGQAVSQSLQPVQFSLSTIAGITHRHLRIDANCSTNLDRAVLDNTTCKSPFQGQIRYLKSSLQVRLT